MDDDELSGEVRPLKRSRTEENGSDDMDTSDDNIGSRSRVLPSTPRKLNSSQTWSSVDYSADLGSPIPSRRPLSRVLLASASKGQPLMISSSTPSTTALATSLAADFSALHALAAAALAQVDAALAAPV